jgi:hypothetical protein
MQPATRSSNRPRTSGDLRRRPFCHETERDAVLQALQTLTEDLR